MSRDPTMDLLINKEQYQFINSERYALDMFEATGNLVNLNPAWLLGAANTYALIYNQPRPNINCRTCIAAFIRPLLYQLRKYEENV